MQKKVLWMQVLSIPIMIFILVTPELIYAKEDTEGEVAMEVDSDDAMLGVESSFNILIFEENINVFIQNILKFKALCEYENFKEEYVQGVCDVGFLEVFKNSMSYSADEKCNETTFRKQCQYLFKDVVGEKTRLGILYEVVGFRLSNDGGLIYSKIYHYGTQEGLERETKDDLNRGDSKFVDLYAENLVHLNKFFSKYQNILIQCKKVKHSGDKAENPGYVEIRCKENENEGSEIIVDMRKDFYGTKKVTKKAERAKREPRTIV